MESPDYFLSGASISEEDSYSNPPPDLIDGFVQPKDGDSPISVLRKGNWFSRKMTHEYYIRLQRLGCAEVRPLSEILKLGIECVHDIHTREFKKIVTPIVNNYFEELKKKLWNPPKDSYTEENLVEDFEDSSLKEIYGAFKEPDLELLMKTYDKLMSFDIDKAENCCLSQASLLYLISKLGVDIHENTELKLRYLEKAVLNLAIPRSSMMKCTPLVLQKLVEALNDFQKLYACSEYLNRVKILELAIMSLL